MDLKLIESMKHSPVHNYVIPGLTSWLIGEPSKHGLIRMFSCDREHVETVVPHSHRYNFHCRVLAGTVRNCVMTPKTGGGDLYEVVSTRNGSNAPGQTEETGERTFRYYEPIWTNYGAHGPLDYAMTHDQIHTIQFGRGARVLFFEGPQVSDESVYLLPVVEGETIPTFRVEPWMFQRSLNASRQS